MRAHTMKADRKKSSKEVSKEVSKQPSKGKSKEQSSKLSKGQEKGQLKGPAKGALQFAPNFTVYLLPDDVVCLYSEDRKFFLHGALYVALANALGKGSKSAAQLVAELKKSFPADKIEEAIQRMTERRYVVSADFASADTVAGYWASLGLPPETAEKTLAACRVRVESVDVEGAKELSTALGELGVNVVTRSPDFTVTLANDYLARPLAELNQDRVTNKTPWLLVQPSGVFPLVGPVFKPGETACWTCLFDRMIRNREIKGFLDRAGARAVATSALVRSSLGQNAIQFAALEIAKVIASGFRTDLNDHIASFDMLGANIA